MGYYIRYETHQDGPYDLVTMIRKIRKGLVPPEALVMEEKETSAQPARSHPQLNTFFREMEEGYVSDQATHTIERLSFGAIFAYGWDFFRHNLLIALISALTVFATLSYALIILMAGRGSLLPSILLTSIAGVYFLCGFVFLIQRMQRQLPFSVQSIRDFYEENWGNLFLFSMAFALINLTAFCLLIVPGVIMLSRLAFAPILVVDRHYHFWHAIESSYRTVTRQDARLYPILIAMIGINIIAAPFVFPLLITLPVTFIGMLELYHQLDFK